MPKRNFVREIKAENVKDINPYDIIYLALKDGSIVLVADKDEDAQDFEDNIEGFSQKKANEKFFNKINKNNNKKLNNNTNSISSKKNTIDTDNNNNIKTKYSYYSKDKSNINTNTYSFGKEQKRPIVLTSLTNQNDNLLNKYLKNKNVDDILNKTYNYGRSNYISEITKTEPNISNYLRREKLEKSFDNINNNQKNNHFVHTIEDMNNNIRNYTYKTDIRVNKRPVSTKPYSTSKYRNNIININNIERHYSLSKTPKRENKGYINGNNNSLINISDLNINTEDNSFMNRTQRIENKDLYQNYFDTNYFKTINSFKRGSGIPIPNRVHNYSNRTVQTPKTYTVKTKEMEIMGRIVNDDNYYRLMDHNHPNTLFEPKCPYCQTLARNNKLCICNIREESISDNHSFHAIFGNSAKKVESNIKPGSSLYKII